MMYESSVEVSTLHPAGLHRPVAALCAAQRPTRNGKYMMAGRLTITGTSPKACVLRLPLFRLCLMSKQRENHVAIVDNAH